MSTLPDRLPSGAWIKTRTGAKAQIVVTSKRDAFDCVLYRLRYPKSGVVSNGLYSRDSLAAEDVILVP